MTIGCAEFYNGHFSNYIILTDYRIKNHNLKCVFYRVTSDCICDITCNNDLAWFIRPMHVFSAISRHAVNKHNRPRQLMTAVDRQFKIT